MTELNIEQIELVSGASHDAAESCLVGGGIGATIGSFFSPVGTAIGGLAGCGLGFAIMML